MASAMTVIPVYRFYVTSESSADSLSQIAECCALSLRQRSSLFISDQYRVALTKNLIVRKNIFY